MALTLIEAAKLRSGDVIRQSIIEIYAMNSDILRVLPFDNIEGNALKYNQEGALPGIGFRGVNEGYTEGTGVVNPVTEPLVIAGGDLDVDKFIVRTMGQDQRSTQEAMKVKALAHKFTNVFIKGDSQTNTKEFDGLQVRLTGNQVISNDTSPDGGALSMTKLDEAIDAVDEPTHLIMSKAMRRVLTAAARNEAVGGHINYTQDEFGRTQTQYNELPILLADRNSDNFASLAADEAYTGGGTADGSSIYVVSFQEGWLQGIQNGEPDVTDLGEQDAKPVFRTRVEWYVGMTLFHPRSAARLRDIDVALAAVV